MVPPAGPGVAYGHDEGGACVRVEGARDAMLELYRRLRDAGKAERPRKVHIQEHLFPQISRIETAECPTHLLPAAPGDAIVAWAPY